MVNLYTNNPALEMKLKLPNGATGFWNDKNEWQCTGSQMGRRNHLASHRDIHMKLNLQLLPMIDHGAYDRWGAYWGQGNPIYIARGFPDAEKYSVTEAIEIYVRAKDREEAKLKVKEFHPNARFYR